MTDFEPFTMDMAVSDAPITTPVTKLGGQPVWLDRPQWPLSASGDDQLMFIGQFRIPDEPGRVAYLFMNSDGDTETWEPEGGENALIVQPGGRIPEFVKVGEHATGPTMAPDITVTLNPADPEQTRQYHQVGGRPRWYQGDETPDGDWRLLLQLDYRGPGYDVNFGGDGIGYGFITGDNREGRFLWQCG